MKLPVATEQIGSSSQLKIWFQKEMRQFITLQRPLLISLGLIWDLFKGSKPKILDRSPLVYCGYANPQRQF